MTKEQKRALLLLIGGVAALTFTGCPDEPKKPESKPKCECGDMEYEGECPCEEDDCTCPPVDYTRTINAFDKDITVKGDASISAANLDTANRKLQDAIDTITFTSDSVPGIAISNVFERGITIRNDNNGLDKNDNKAMTIGIGYLSDNNNSASIIGNAIIEKILIDDYYSRAFTKDTVRMAKGEVDAKGFAGKVIAQI
jgi:hypothetical protein